mmetsp:Transcript_77207/g.153252  ORF Transcript_77207/g.153252 Transcript_77207/m.153252 type:complete len:143 (-) Transcript_77207:222-650(-)
MYADELEKWANMFPREQLRVIHTDDLSQKPQKIMDDIFKFLHLSPIDIGRDTRMCVHGKAGVMDVLNMFENSVRIGSNSSVTTDNPELRVAACDQSPEDMHREPLTGAMHHNIDPELHLRLRSYFDPFNKRLYKFLGRDLGW